MPTNYMSVITLPVDVAGVITPITFTIKDQEARDLIAGMGSAIIWIGVTTTPISDGDSTNPITINGQSVTAVGGNMTAYDGTEFVWDTESAVWQAFGTGNLGNLAYQDSASGDYTPAGSVTLTETVAPTTTTVNSISDAGESPYFTVSGETATFHVGTLPTKGTDTTVLTSAGTHTAAFTGTQATITVN